RPHSYHQPYQSHITARTQRRGLRYRAGPDSPASSGESANARAIFCSQSGGQVESASSTATNGARAAVTPAALACTAPGVSQETTRAPSCAATSAVPSVEALSTTITSTTPGLSQAATLARQ